MPVWWGTFAYMIAVSVVGMIVYKNRKERISSLQTEEAYIDNHKSIGLLFALLSFFLLVYFVGNRCYIFDTTEYQYLYDIFYTGDLDTIGDIFSSGKKGPLFYTLLVLHKHFFPGTYTDWFMAMAIIQATSIAILFYRYSDNYAFSIYLFVCVGGMLWFANGIRQFLASAIILFFSSCVFNRRIRNIIVFLFVVIIAYYIHSSAIVWIPVYFLIAKKPWSRSFIIYSIVFSIAVFLFFKSSYLRETEYSYLNNSEYQSGVNPFRVLVMAVPTIIAFIKRKELESKITPFYSILINLSVITTELYIVGMFTSGIVGRLPAYFSIFGLVLLPWLLNNSFNVESKRTIYLIAIIGYFIFFCYEMYITKKGIYISTNLNLDFRL